MQFFSVSASLGLYVAFVVSLFDPICPSFDAF